jgi:Holliday junction resolvase
MNNKLLGTRYEEKVAQILYDHGYWVTLLTASRTGQPADIIAIKGTEVALIDAKFCARDRFELRRVEPNQIRAMSLLEKRSEHTALATFVLGFSTGNYIVSWERISELISQGVKSINLADCEELITLEEWAK